MFPIQFRFRIIETELSIVKEGSFGSGPELMSTERFRMQRTESKRRGRISIPFSLVSRLSNVLHLRNYGALKWRKKCLSIRLHISCETFAVYISKSDLLFSVFISRFFSFWIEYEDEPFAIIANQMEKIPFQFLRVLYTHTDGIYY